VALRMIKKTPPAETAVVTETATVTTPAVVKVEAAADPITEHLVALTSEYVGLYKKLETVGGKTLLARMERIKKALQDYANANLPKAEVARFDSPEGTLEYSELSDETIVQDPQKLVAHLQEKFGTEVAFSVVRVSLGDLKKVLSPMEMEAFTTKQNGSRTLKAVLVKAHV
jgi:hypothetical protein